MSDVNTGWQKDKLIGHTDGIQSVVFSRDGQTLATGSPTEVRLWDVNTGQQKMILQDPDLSGVLIAYSPDGRTLATRSADGPEMRLWNIITGEPLKVLTGHTRFPRNFAFSPDGGTLVSGSWDELLLWDVVSGEQKGLLPTQGRCNASGLALSPDGRILVTEWSGVDIALWDVTTGKQLVTFSGHGNQHQHQITSLAFNPNGNMVASASVDGTVLLWDLTHFIPVPLGVSRLATDVNDDGQVNIQDLVAIAAAFGETGETPADVNDDGQVNIQDLVAIAAAFGETAAGAPAATSFFPETVQRWLSAAEQLNLTDATSQRGIRFLEQLCQR